MKAYIKDIRQTVKKEKKRFFSIMVIVALGVTMVTGIKAGCDDLLLTADRFFKEHNLHDISVQSTLGMTDDDIEALSALDGVSTVEGFYSENVYTKVDGLNRTAEIKMLSKSGINIPYIIDGVLPQNPGEIAVTENYIQDTGKTIGDIVEFEEDMGEDSEDEKTSDESEEKPEENTEEDSEEEDLEIEIEEEEEEPTFANTQCKITAIVIDPTDVNLKNGASSSIRSASASDYIFFVPRKAVNTEIYTAVFMKIDGSENVFCYSDEYNHMVDDLTDIIAAQIKEDREQARTEQIKSEAGEKIVDAEQTMNEKFAEADEEIADAKQEIEDAKKELADGEKELNEKIAEADEEFAKAWQEIADAKAQLASGEGSLLKAEEQIKEGFEQLEAGEKELEENKKKLEESEKELVAGEEQLATGKVMLKQQEEMVMSQLSDGITQIITAKETTQATGIQIESEQLQPLVDMYGEAWPTEQWNNYRAVAATAGAPVVQAQLKVGQLEQELQNMTAGTSEYDVKNAELEIAKAEYEQAQVSMLSNEELILAQENLVGAFPEENPASEGVAALGIALGQIDAMVSVLNMQLQELNQQQKNAKQQFESAWQEISANEVILTEGRKQLEEGRKQWEAGKQTLEESRKVLEEAWKQIEDGWGDISAGWDDLNEGIEELEKQQKEAYEKIAEGRQELEDGRIELADGEKELEENILDYNEKRQEAEGKIADAWEEIEDIDTAKWYIQNRYNLSSYKNIETDSGAIAIIGKIFPLIFLVVAILISLTTINRMVEEDRGLIGTYQALGFTNSEIRFKYVIYALCASIIGGVLGDICGYIVLPEIIFIVFGNMYILPEYYLDFNFVYGIGGPLLFIVAIMLAAWVTCNTALKHMPAELMRPKAPRAGSRVFLEYIGFIWNRFSFLNKVTARNLFRYKKRLFMTIIGIAGCMALLICGFAIKDTITELMPRQYGEIYNFDLMAVVNPDDNETLLEYISDSENVTDYMNLKIDTVTLKSSAGDTDRLQLYVLPDVEAVKKYINVINIKDNRITTVEEGGVYITRNAGLIMDFGAGDKVRIQDMLLNEYEFTVTAMLENFTGNFIIMTQQMYEDTFGDYESNAVLACMDDSINHKEFADEMGQLDWVLSVMSTENMKEDFQAVFDLINMVVYVIIVLAASLAFVVLFTLSTTNISERERELATIKVLGFYDNEVHSYVNKETLILTMMGIVLGIPLGTAVGHFLTYALTMPSIYFAVTIYKVSYLIAIGFTLGFALIVNCITNHALNVIDPVEALKSIE